jgi:predicted outer membrane protein
VNQRSAAVAIKLTLTEDETEILIDALEADMEGYVEAAKEARGNNNREDVKTFTEAAERILALKGKLEALLGE